MSPTSKPFKVAVVWRGDAQARREASAETSRLTAIFAALAAQGVGAEPCVWSEALTGEARAQMLACDGVLVWVDPIATATGERRGAARSTTCCARSPRQASWSVRTLT